MTRNPCRGCKDAFELNGRYYNSLNYNCAVCEKLKSHTKYLESKRKYEKGELITSLDELISQEIVMWGNKPTHEGFYKSLQLRVVIDGLKNGWFRYAVRKRG